MIIQGLRWFFIFAAIACWLTASISVCRSYPASSNFRQALAFSFKMYTSAMLFLCILIFSYFQLNFEIISLRAAEITTLILAVALFLALMLRILHLNYVVARVMEARTLSGKIGFNIYQLLAAASIAMVVLRSSII
jgi:hypothetical protein